MNVRRIAEAVANIANHYYDMKVASNAAASQELGRMIDREFHDLTNALDLTEPEVQRFKAHFDKQMYGR